MSNSKQALHKRRKLSRHDGTRCEPIGPVTPDHQTPLGDTPEAHDEIVPQDLPKRHPGRRAAERLARDGDGTTRGNV
ncbi:MAG: hypothetical protein M3417_09005 [Actinomycetota bacterium]|nr:hypothetical protein [Actinomycetota bacterium]